MAAEPSTRRKIRGGGQGGTGEQKLQHTEQYKSGQGFGFYPERGVLMAFKQARDKI